MVETPIVKYCKPVAHLGNADLVGTRTFPDTPEADSREFQAFVDSDPGPTNRSLQLEIAVKYVISKFCLIHSEYPLYT